MATLKTRPTTASVSAFLATIPDQARRADCRKLVEILRRATGARPRMWGPSIVGFGTYHYRYASGREGDWFVAGFSPRKEALTLYLMGGYDRHPALMRKLGKHKRGRGCLYLKRLQDVDLAVLRELVDVSVAHAGAGGASGG
jgi:hypothetical protein